MRPPGGAWLSLPGSFFVSVKSGFGMGTGRGLNASGWFKTSTTNSWSESLAMDSISAFVSDNLEII